MTLQAIRYDGHTLVILDQLKLPHVVEFVPIQDSRAGWQAIKDMKVRGAPAIAIVAILALAVELQSLVREGSLPADCDEIQSFIIQRLHMLVTSRPTAVNLSEAAGRFEHRIAEYVKQGVDSKGIVEGYLKDAQKMLEDDLEDNKNIGAHGAQWILDNAPTDKVNVLTHCNTGSLATSGYGTALGVIRSLHANKTLNRAYCTETRPYNQGSRLTAFELVHDEIPATLITDSMVAALLANEKTRISAIVVGADRVAANGDTANKIGTYGLAVLAKHHGVKFVVAAPRTSIDPKTSSGKDIIVEERPAVELVKVQGRAAGNDGDALKLETVQVAAPGIDVWNPAFDITPAALIDAIVTEVGVMEKNSQGQFRLDSIFDSSSR